MSRRARAVPFARMRPGPHLRQLANLPMADWPRHPRMARGILVDELELPDKTAWPLLQSSIAAAHACAEKINQRAQDIFQIRRREGLRKIFVRMAKCATRLPASRRHALDRKVRTHLCRMTIDSESIETLIESLIIGFGKRPTTEPSLTVLRAVLPRAPSANILDKTDKVRLRRNFAEAASLMKEDFSGLPAIDQRNVEAALTTLIEGQRDTFGTADVCTTISSGLASNSKGESSWSVADLITDYVVAVAKNWRQHGLRPSRARDPDSAAYRSRFHRFADLVLTSVVEPWSKRHAGDQHEALAKLRKAHARLPQEIRTIVRGPRRTDIEWLVADEHLKRALATGSKNDPQNTV